MKGIRPPRKLKSKSSGTSSKNLVASLRSEIRKLKARVASLQTARPNSPFKNASPKGSPKSPAFVAPSGWKRSKYSVPLNPRHVEWNTHGPGNLSVSEWHEHRKNPFWMKLAGFKSPAPILMKRSSKHVKRDRTWENNQLEKAFHNYYTNQQLQSLRNHGQMKSKGLREVAKPMNIV